MTIRHTLAAGLFAAALATAAVAAEPEGVYSADGLLDADVYTSDSNEHVGEIDDLIFDNDMQIKSFIIETEDQYGLNGKSYVVPPDRISVETTPSDEATEPEYRITLNADSKQLSSYPVYNDAWWGETQARAASAWKQTRESASDAWTRIKHGTNELIDRAQGQTGNAAEKTGKEIDNAADNATDAAGNAADSTGEAASDASQ